MLTKRNLQKLLVLSTFFNETLTKNSPLTPEGGNEKL
jgi:hypothetical protein